MAVPRDDAIDRKTVAAVIPAYFEEKHIADVVRRTLAQLDNVLVVDDGSTDATAAAARNAGAEVIVHPQNLGKGESIKAGLRHWLERSFSYVFSSRWRRPAFARRDRPFSRNRCHDSRGTLDRHPNATTSARCPWCGVWSIAT